MVCMLLHPLMPIASSPRLMTAAWCAAQKTCWLQRCQQLWPFAPSKDTARADERQLWGTSGRRCWGKVHICSHSHSQQYCGQQS